MARIIGIDYGKKRVGLAVTDPIQIISSPLNTVEEINLISFLKNYISTEEVEAIVVGWPLSLNGKENSMTLEVDQLIIKLQNTFPNIKIFKHDERFTSKIAKESLLIGGKNKKFRSDKSNIDKISASLILSSFLRKLSNIHLS